MEIDLKVPEVILPKEEIRSLRPKDRDAYTSKLILDILELNISKGITIPEIAQRTKLSRITIAKHLSKLVAMREAYSVSRGKLTIYYKNGRIVHQTNMKDTYLEDRIYSFYRLNNEDGNFIYIQEKERDKFNRVVVKGGILIRDQDFIKFLSELQSFALEVSEHES
jgi:DNA-binding transcriptional ArsR family regulator